MNGKIITSVFCLFTLSCVYAQTCSLNVAADWPSSTLRCVNSTKDEQGQKDLNQMCANTIFTNGVPSTRYFFSFDDTQFQSQTSVGCILITDQSDGTKASYALCVSVTGNTKQTALLE